MAIVNREELLNRIGAFGDDDNVIGLLEDVSDTLDDLERRVAETGDWERKYNELDAEWRGKYRARFMEGVNSPGGGDSEVDRDIATAVIVPETVENQSFEDLFTEVEE